MNNNKLREIRNKATAIFATPPPVRRDSDGIGSVFTDVLFGAVIGMSLTSVNALGPPSDLRLRSRQFSASPGISPADVPRCAPVDWPTDT